MHKISFIDLRNFIVGNTVGYSVKLVCKTCNVLTSQERLEFM